VVELLLDTGADVNAQEYEEGQTALGYARTQGHEDVVDLLEKWKRNHGG
jgi:ankyrin repeat protein